MPNALAATNRTGYPLQAALEAIVRAGRDKHGLSVRGHECHWRHPVSGESHFLDLLLSGVCSAPFGHVSLQQLFVIECKRIDGYWTFPIARTTPAHFDEVRLLTSLFGKEVEPHFRSWAYGPREMHHSEYCTLSLRTQKGAEQSDSRTLEPWAAELVSACQAFSKLALLPSGSQPVMDGIIYVPVLVTTASLHALLYDPLTVSLADGRLPSPPVTEEQEVPFVVLSKDLGFEPGMSVWPFTGRSQRPAHQDVFIVNAAHLDSFLRQCISVEEGRA